MTRAITFISLLIGTVLHSAIAKDPLLPSHRIVCYYGNFYSPRMGILGEYPPDQMIRLLHAEIKKWSQVDPTTSIIPALDYIAVVAQRDAGKDGKYRKRMPDEEIQKALDLANKIDGLAILDVQVGLSSVQLEIPRLEPHLKLPNVMLALDPEYSMPNGIPPCKIIGSMTAQDINYAINYLANIVDKYNLPPKILIIHRFTQRMVTHYKEIKPRPEVQVVINMDGWGGQAKKLASYKAFIAAELVQFTGFKVFYKEDLKEANSKLFTPEQILNLKPAPVFIMYQ